MDTVALERSKHLVTKFARERNYRLLGGMKGNLWQNILDLENHVHSLFALCQALGGYAGLDSGECWRNLSKEKTGGNALPPPGVPRASCMPCALLTSGFHQETSASSKSSPGRCLSSLLRSIKNQELTPALIYLLSHQGKAEPGVVLHAAFILGILHEHQQIFLGSSLFGRTKRGKGSLYFSVFQWAEINLCYPRKL